MKLKFFNLGGGGKLKDLSPLRGMPLEFVCVNDTAVEDLSPLAGAPLHTVLIERTPMRDLTPVIQPKLTNVSMVDAPHVELECLRGLSLTKLTLSYDATRHRDLILSMPNLELLNYVPVKEFWAKNP